MIWHLESHLAADNTTTGLSSTTTDLHESSEYTAGDATNAGNGHSGRVAGARPK